MPDEPLTNQSASAFRRGGPGDPRQLEDIFDAVDPAAAAQPRQTMSLASKSAPPPNLPGAGMAAPPLPPEPESAPPPPQGMAAPRTGGVDDIFSGVERSTPVVRAPRPSAPPVRPGVPGGVGQPATSPQPFPTDEERAAIAKQPPLFASRKFTILLVSLLLVVALGGGGWYAYIVLVARGTQSGTSPTGGTQPIIGVTPVTSPSPIGTPTPPNPMGSATPSPVPAETTLDSDHDGLTDEEETKFGTNLFATDTDADGLTDRDEVRAFNSDPKNPDSDGDGFTDGTEVMNGYSPIGPGKIKEVPRTP